MESPLSLLLWVGITGWDRWWSTRKLAILPCAPPQVPFTKPDANLCFQPFKCLDFTVSHKRFSTRVGEMVWSESAERDCSRHVAGGELSRWTLHRQGR